MSRSLADEGWVDEHMLNSRIDMTQAGANLSTEMRYGKDETYANEGDFMMVTHSYYDAFREKTKKEVDRIRHLQRLKISTPSKSDEYDQMIKDEYSKLNLQRDERIKQRTDFLQTFYYDLYKLPQKEFTDKYKRHCTGKIMQIMKTIYQQNHSKNGYTWAIFGDNTVHGENDVTITQLNGKSLVSTDPTQIFPPDNPWYQVTMSEHNVDIMLEGEGKHILITSIVNHYLNIAIFDNDNIYTNSNKYMSIPN